MHILLLANPLGQLIPLVVVSFLGVMIYQIWSRRRRRQEIVDTMSLINAGRHAEAAEIFEKAVQRDETDAISWFHLGLCREMSGETQKATEIYESISDDPRVDFAARTRLQELRQGYVLNPQRLKALGKFEMGVGLLGDGEIQQAEEAFLEGLALHPAYKPVHYYLAVCSEIAQKPHEAVEHYERISGDDKDTTLVDHRLLAAKSDNLWKSEDTGTAIALRKAWNYLQIDIVERAIEELEELVRRNPDEYTAHFGLAQCHILTGTAEEAKEHYEMVPSEDFRYEDAQKKLAELDAMIAKQPE